jgi:hypothetical protein
VNSSFLLVLIGGAILEWTAFFNFPVWLARLALLPVETRALDVPPRALASLEVGGGDYRTAPSHALDLARLAAPARVESADATVFFFARPAHFVAVSTLSLVRKPRALVRVDLSGHDGRIDLRARCYPAGVPSIVLGMLWASICQRSVGPALFALLAGWLLVSIHRRAARLLVDAVAGEVSRCFKMLER